jgi:hypothetical protein
MKTPNQQNYFIIARSATHQDDQQSVEDFGEPLCNVPLFQTSAIPSSLKDSQKTYEVQLHIKPHSETRSKRQKLHAEKPKIGLKRKHKNSRGCFSDRSTSGRETIYSLHAKSEPTKSSRSEPLCTFCNETDTPMWRKGPEGPGTLCNVCGLIYAKRESKGKSLLLSREYSRGTRDTISDDSSRQS